MRIAVAFAREAAKSPEARLCLACTEVLAVTGTGITIMTGRNTGPVCVSNERIAALEDLQFTLGEGPCQDAFRTGTPVHAPSLDAAAMARWPGFIGSAIATGVSAVFAYPLMTGRSKIGVLTIYQDAEGDLSRAQNEDSLAVAEVVTLTVLAMQADAGVGTLSDDLDDVVAHRAEIHQASGIVSVQLAIAVTEALIRIRAHAYAHGRAIGEVASDIVAHRLYLPDDRTRED